MKFKTSVNRFAEGSCLAVMGDTEVLCTATVEEKVPRFLRGKGQGWVTAEYAMVPRSCKERVTRDITRGKISGRSHEIQRLIGRSLRSVVDMEALGERTILIDCDVLLADGGTRCAAISGAWVAMSLACQKLIQSGVLTESPIRDHVAAVSVGIRDGNPLLDLSYPEDAGADVDMNIVMTGQGKFVEIQGTAEGIPFDDAELKKLLTVAKKGIKAIVLRQKKVL